MASSNRQWNLVATLVVIVVTAYLGAVGAGFFMGRIDAAMFKDLTLPVILPVLGYLAALLRSPQ